jgi:chromosome segregation ATPase
MPVGENTKTLLSKIQDPDKRAKLEAAIAEVDDIATELEAGFLRQQDYTKKTQELADRRKTLEGQWTEANTEYQRMLKEHEDIQASLSSTQREKDEAATKLAEAEKKLKEAPQFDPTKYLTPDQVKEQMQKLAAGFTAYTGRTLKVMQEHRKLFGEELDPEELMKGASASGKPPDEYWNETYKVPDKRKALADEAEAKRIAEAEQKGYQKALAEAANPATRTLKSSETPFYTPKDEKEESPWDNSVMTPTDTKFMEELQRVTGS